MKIFQHSKLNSKNKYMSRHANCYLYFQFPGSWRLIFGVTTLVLVATASTFLAFGSGAEQAWNKTATEETLEIPTVQHEASVDSEVPEQEAVQQNLLSQA
jgi:hypothetical protein